jgi:hypothetical protein
VAKAETVGAISHRHELGFDADVTHLAYPKIMRLLSRKVIGLPLLMAGWTTLLILIALSASVVQAAPIFIPGLLQEEFWQGIGNGPVEAGTAGTPTFTTYLSSFEIPPDRGTTYAVRLSGFFIPATTGDYSFNISADDTADLFLSTDGTLANKRMIAQQIGWNATRAWVTDNGGNLDQRISTTWTNATGVAPFASGIHMVAGTKYYIEGVMNEFGGGDDFAIRYKLLTDADPADGDPSNLTGNLIGVNVAGPFTAARAFGSASLDRATVVYSVPVDPATGTNVANYAINGGLTVTSATLLDNQTSVLLVTSKQTTNQVYAVTVKDVKDRSGGALTPNPASVNFTGFGLVPGTVGFEVWWDNSEAFSKNSVTPDVTGTAVDSLTSNPRYPDRPDIIATATALDTRTVFAGDNNENYGGRLRTFLTPTDSASYEFFLRSDDASQLFLSTDDSFANLAQIAEEVGCCNAFMESGAAQTSTSIALVAGKKYALQVLWKEGGGGDYAQVAWRKAGDTTAAGTLKPLRGSVLNWYANPEVTLEITQNPQNQTAVANGPVTFSVRYAAQSFQGTNASVQWQKNGADIPGATSQDYTIPFVDAADNGAKFHAVVSISSLITKTSTDATLTVTPDTTPPTIKSINGGATSLTILFSEPLDATSAGDKGNYAIDQGVTVSSAAVSAAASGEGVVKLAITGTAIGKTYTLTVNGVKDRGANAIAANTKATFKAAKAFFDFDDGQVPLNTELQGSTTIEPTGGFNGGGGLQLTPPVNSQQGGFYIPDLDGGAPVFGIQVDFKLLITDPSGNPADGVSFSWGSDVSSQAVGEEGTGTGLIVEFDTFDNGATDDYGIDVKWNGEEIALLDPPLPLDTANSGFILVNKEWTDVSIGVYGNGDFYLTHHGTNYYNKLVITNFTAISGGNFLFGGRTGGENARQVIDNLSINTFLAVTPAPTNAPPVTGGAKLTATKAGANLTIAWTPTGGKLQSTPALAGAATVWKDEGTANPASIPISATGNLYLRVVGP